MLGIAKEVFQVVPGGPAELIQKGSGDVILLSHPGHLAVDALMDPHVFDNFDTGVRISIVASGKLHRATSGEWWLVTNHHDSGLLIIPHCSMSLKFLKLLKRGHENASRGSLANPPLASICA